MKHFALLLLGTAGFSVPALANSVTYDIYFAATGGPNLIAPTGGSFTYDSGTGFWNFRVQWDGLEFDLTSEANAPIFSPPHAGQCNEVGSNWQFGFAILSQHATGCNPVYLWDGLAESGGSLFDFRLIDNPPAPYDLDLCIGCTGARISGYDGGGPFGPGRVDQSFGTWTLSPEPGTFGLLVLGTAATVGIRRLMRATSA
jgi:hypothetical protein